MNHVFSLQNIILTNASIETIAFMEGDHPLPSDKIETHYTMLMSDQIVGAQD